MKSCQANRLGPIGKMKLPPIASPGRASIRGNMYQFKEEMDYVGCFWFDKKLIENNTWRLLPKSSKSIYPTILYFRNRASRLSFADQETLAIVSGLSEKTVSKGISGLKGIPNIKVIPYITKKGKRSNKYEITEPPIEKGRAFPFKKVIFEGGNWSQLKPSAQALYPVMRTYGWFDLDMYADVKDIEVESNEFSSCYNARDFDFCNADLDVLAEYSGISYRSLESALYSLESRHLIERYTGNDDFRGWKVFLNPPQYYKRSYLNNQISNSFAHKVRKRDIQEKSTVHL